jgi:hypothetical protein
VINSGLLLDGAAESGRRDAHLPDDVAIVLSFVADGREK